MKAIRITLNSMFPIVLALYLISTALAVVHNVRGITNGEKDKAKGLILSRNGDLIDVREDGADRIVVVVLDDDTQVKLKKKGPLGIVSRKQSMDVTALLPGLRIEAQGVGNAEGQLVAHEISFNPADFKTATAVDSQTSPLRGKQAELEAQQQQTARDVQTAQAEANRANAGVAELHDRMSSLDDYDTKYMATTYFDVNKTILTDESKKELDELVQKALPLKGYMIEVAGYADTSGNAARNQQLSEGRAEAVVQYLQQVGRVPLRRILAPVGLGTTNSAADNATAEGRKQNRRVEVRVVVNKGLNS